jgi:hypothetical protein
MVTGDHTLVIFSTFPITSNINMTRVVSFTPVPFYPPKRSVLPTELGTGWAPGPVWTLLEKRKIFWPSSPQSTINNDYAISASFIKLISCKVCANMAAERKFISTFLFDIYN